jgi:hypothetical protein
MSDGAITAIAAVVAAVFTGIAALLVPVSAFLINWRNQSLAIKQKADERADTMAAQHVADWKQRLVDTESHVDTLHTAVLDCEKRHIEERAARRECEEERAALTQRVHQVENKVAKVESLPVLTKRVETLEEKVEAAK